MLTVVNTRCSIASSGTAIRICTVAVVLCSCDVTLAQKPPELGYVYPPSVQAGTEVDVQLGGYDFTPDMQFFVHDDQISLSILGAPGEFLVAKPPYWFGEKGMLPAFPIPREVSARIRIPPDTPAGLTYWQVANANGSSTTAVFHVSDEPETLEARDRGFPQMLEHLPVRVSGRLERIAEVDRYQFNAEHDGPISIELFARRLGSNFNGIMEVRDSEDRLIADTADTQGLDTALTFSSMAGESYTLSLHDVDFRGHRAFVYRLAMVAGPRVVTTVPAVLRRGQHREIEFIGYGVATGSANLESTKRTIEVSGDSQRDVLRYRLETAYGTALPIEIPLSDSPTAIEADLPVVTSPETEGLSGTKELTVPCDVTAVLTESGEATFTWHAKAGDVWKIAALSRAIGTDLDLALQITDAAGKPLANNDDLPGTPDAGLEFTVPADGTFTCAVSDLSGRPCNLSSVYRLNFSLVRPDFSLSLPQQVNLPAADRGELKVTAARVGGHAEEIAIEVRGLPGGVTLPPDLKIPGDKSELSIPLESASDAVATASLIQVTGESTVGDQIVSRVAACKASGNLCPRHAAENQLSRAVLATTLRPKYSIELVDRNRQRAVHRGTTYPAPFVIRRREGSESEVLLVMAANQSRHRQGVRGPVVVVPAEKDEALYPCFMPEWLATDKTTRMLVLGMAQQPDPRGNLRYVTAPADAQITMILEGALLKLSQHAVEPTVTAGNAFEIPVEISRSAKLQTPVAIQLDVPEEINGLIRIVPANLTVPIGQNQAVVSVETVNDSRLRGRWIFQVKAVALQDDQWPVVSQAEVTVDFVQATSEKLSVIGE